MLVFITFARAKIKPAMAKKKVRATGQNMSFLDHLEDLRWHLIRATIAILVCTIVAFANKSFVFDTVIFAAKDPNFAPYRAMCWLSNLWGGNIFCFESLPFELLNIKMAGQFTMHLWVSFIAGFIIAFPYVFFEIWRFVSPGLHLNERKNSRGIIFITTFLFLTGVLFGYFVIAPFSIQFLGTYSISPQIVNRFDVSSFISTVTSVTLAAGLVFELPVIVYFLSKVGILTPDLMRNYRKHAIVVILVVAAILTPPDVTSQILVTLPVLLLYEISIGVSARVNKRRIKKETKA